MTLTGAACGCFLLLHIFFALRHIKKQNILHMHWFSPGIFSCGRNLREDLGSDVVISVLVSIRQFFFFKLAFSYFKFTEVRANCLFRCRKSRSRNLRFTLSVVEAF